MFAWFVKKHSVYALDDKNRSRTCDFYINSYNDSVVVG
jgi:hypothetical protein